MGRQEGSFNRFGKISDDPNGDENATVTSYEELHGAGPATDPLDHDGDGKKGGSEKGAKSTRSKGAAKAKAEEAAPAADETPVAETATDTEQTPTQDEETPAEAEQTSTDEEVSEEKGE